MADTSSEPQGSSEPNESASNSDSNENESAANLTDGSIPARRRRRGSRGGRRRSSSRSNASSATTNVQIDGEDSQSESSVGEGDSEHSELKVPNAKAAPTKIASKGGLSGNASRQTSRAIPQVDASVIDVEGGAAALDADVPVKPRRSPARLQGQQSNRAKKAIATVAPGENVGDPSNAPIGGGTTRAADQPKVGTASSDLGDAAGESTSESSSAAAKRRRRRGGRKKTGVKKSPDLTATGIHSKSIDELVVEEEALELDEEALEKRRGRERKGRPVGRYTMCVQKRGTATQIAVLEGRSLIEHYVSRPNDDANQIDGNVYLSRVQNVLPGMEAAFVDIGTPKNAVLYRGDVRYDADDLAEGANVSEQPRIEQMIKSGQTITCQVTKNPIGTKGARLTQEVSLPGRFVVLMPNSSTYGISKRLPDDERKRLRKVLDEVKPAQHGIIVRTAAEGVTAEELRRDVQRLLRQWEKIESQAAKSQAPALLYREPDIAVRIIREEFNKHYRSVIIDDLELFEEVRDYVSSISPELADRIEFYDRSVEPLALFERHHVHEQLHKALDRKVWLPSGGSLIIERTEALTVIDVNTGKNVGKSNLEETVYRNNLEAAEEIAHQLRLRDIGGIIVIDFIDMEIKKNRDDVLTKLRDALAGDKTRTQAYPIGELGLVEMTRKRISEGLVESFSQVCPSCTGRGFVIDEDLMTD